MTLDINGRFFIMIIKVIIFLYDIIYIKLVIL